MDPGETWWERLVTHEYNECYLYYSFMQQESDPKVNAIWELHLPQALTFEPNKAFLRELLATQMDLTTLGAGYVRDQHERFQRMQEPIHGGEKPPTERVIDMHREKFGEDYRVETEGQHPDSRLRKLNS
jgi:hypothetical protein